MSFRLKKDIFDTPAITVPLDGSTDLADGDLVYRDTTNGYAEAATSSAGSTTNLLGVVVGNPSATATECNVIPVIPNAGQLWEVDCTSNTAANQLLKAHEVTDSATMNNTSTHDATVNGCFIAIALVGAAADKKLLGHFAVAGQVTA